MTLGNVRSILENQATTNKQTVQAIFAAFGSGDMPGLLAHIASDVEWALPGPASVPFTGAFQGHEGVTNFFVALGSSVEFTKFEVKSFVAENDDVVVLGYEEATVKASGKSYANPWAMVFSFADGKVVRWQSYEDTAALAAAFE